MEPGEPSCRVAASEDFRPYDDDSGEIAMKEIDPVCGMEVDPRTAENVTRYKGKTYYFCTPLCRIQFESSPERFLGRRDEGVGHGEAAD